MTREEAISRLIFFKNSLENKEDIAVIDMAIKALEQVPKLQNRCYALTHGQLCVFCPQECEHKAESDPHESEDKK